MLLLVLRSQGDSRSPEGKGWGDVCQEWKSPKYEMNIGKVEKVSNTSIKYTEINF